jgi:hypothetical protein
MSYLLVYAIGWASCKAWEYKSRAWKSFKAGWDEEWDKECTWP